MNAGTVNDVEAIAQAHLSCRFPSQECDPVQAALAARLSDRQTAELIRAIEGYHDPLTRILVRAAQKAGTEE